jgi:hypothetical protein
MQSAFSTRRLIAGSTALFLVILAFLAGRVHAGTDPAQATTSARQVRPAPESDSGPYDDFPFGVPDQGTVPDQGRVPSPGGQDPNPPMTQSS